MITLCPSSNALFASATHLFHVPNTSWLKMVYLWQYLRANVDFPHACGPTEISNSGWEEPGILASAKFN
jgi:hypothetical protein